MYGFEFYTQAVRSGVEAFPSQRHLQILFSYVLGFHIGLLFCIIIYYFIFSVCVCVIYSRRGNAQLNQRRYALSPGTVVWQFQILFLMCMCVIYSRRGNAQLNQIRYSLSPGTVVWQFEISYFILCVCV